ncbi:MAG TPA: hypothetical protein VJ828_11080 [Lacipirellulaceae bacterium]|nr:hypothetical protein [Lacipirellulaceae bacterium]
MAQWGVLCEFVGAAHYSAAWAFLAHAYAVDHAAHGARDEGMPPAAA